LTENKIQSDEEKANEELALRYQNDIFQEGELEVADEVLSPDFVIHNPDLPEELRKGTDGDDGNGSGGTIAEIGYPVVSCSASSDDGNIPSNAGDGSLNARWTGHGIGQF